MDAISWHNTTVSLGSLQPWERNPKRISKSHAERLLEYWRKIGQFQSIAIGPDGEIYDGHQRYSVLLAAFGKDYLVDVRQSSRPLTDAERQELVIAAHAGTTGQWDWDALAAWDAGALKTWGMDEELVQGWGADIAALKSMLESEEPPVVDDPGPQIDKAAELREKWGVEPGQLWSLGDHRLICGDCTDAAVVARVMDGERAQLLFTSPPYWVGKDYERETSLQAVKKFIADCAAIWTKSVTLDGGRIIVNCSTASAKAINSKADPETLFTLAWWQDAMREHNWLMRHCRIWLKHGDMAAPRVAARSDVVDQHWETIPEFLPTFYYPDGLRRGQEKIGMKWAQLGIWDDIHGKRSADGMHIAAFPIELPERYLKLYTIQGEIVLEPFCGSGTTLIACERLGRRGRGIEIDPGYCAVAIERWAEATGQTPELVSDGGAVQQ